MEKRKKRDILVSNGMRVYESSVRQVQLVNSKNQVRKAKILSSKNAYDYSMELFNKDTLEVHETVIAIFLNSANITVGWYLVSSGGIAGTVVDPRLILAAALPVYTTSMVLLHNHPSGRAYPSEPDKILTRELKEACSTMRINLIDHLVVTMDSYYSFADEGQI